jgi:hypothetical protein
MLSFALPPDPIRLVQEELSVAERRFGVLINGHDDCFGRVGSANLREELNAEPLPEF